MQTTRLLNPRIAITRCLILLLTLLTATAFSQSPNWLWAKGIGGTGDDRVSSIALDAYGNVYTTGRFQGTVDFDPGAGIFNLTSAGFKDIFISKSDPSGNFIWAKAIGGTPGANDYGYSIAIDASGYVYTTGYFFGTADFDPGPGVFNLTWDGGFISKLDSSGNFVWARIIGGTGISIALDASGYVYTTGYFSGTLDFDPDSSATFNLTSAGQIDLFISRLDSDGNLVWAKSMGGTNVDHASSITIDAAGSGDIYTTGYFYGTADFNPDSSATFYLTSAGSPAGYPDIFISKLDSSGNFVWAKSMGGIGSGGLSLSIATDPSGGGDVYTTGQFWGMIDFDPGAGTFNLTSTGSPGSEDIFISRLDSSGNFIWAKSMGGATGGGAGYDIVIDVSGNVFTTGFFSGTADFNPGAGTFNLTAPGGSKDIFISKLNSTGNFVWAKAAGVTGDNRGLSIVLDSSGNAFLTGWFLSASITFGPTTMTNADINGNSEDIFIAKLSSAPVGMSDATTPPRITSIYPNPAMNQLSVSSKQFAINNIEIYNALRQKVYSEHLRTPNSRLETVIDVSKLPGGIYLVQIKSEDFIETKKLIVAK